jgi:hypothetical protein
MNCLQQHQQTKLGSGYILGEASKDVRRVVSKSNAYFEKAFYGNMGSGGLPDYQNGAGYQNDPAFQNGYNYQNGFGNGYGDQYYGDGSGYEAAPNVVPNAGGMPN